MVKVKVTVLMRKKKPLICNSWGFGQHLVKKNQPKNCVTCTYTPAAVMPMNRFFSSMSIRGWFAQGTNDSCQAAIPVKCGHSAIKLSSTFHSLVLGEAGVFQSTPWCCVREDLALCISSLMHDDFI